MPWHVGGADEFASAVQVPTGGVGWEHLRERPRELALLAQHKVKRHTVCMGCGQAAKAGLRRAGQGTSGPPGHQCRLHGALQAHADQNAGQTGRPRPVHLTCQGVQLLQIGQVAPVFVIQAAHHLGGGVPAVAPLSVVIARIPGEPPVGNHHPHAAAGLQHVLLETAREAAGRGQWKVPLQFLVPPLPGQALPGP